MDTVKQIAVGVKPLFDAAVTTDFRPSEFIFNHNLPDFQCFPHNRFGELLADVNSHSFLTRLEPAEVWQLSKEITEYLGRLDVDAMSKPFVVGGLVSNLLFLFWVFDKFHTCTGSARLAC